MEYRPVESGAAVNPFDDGIPFGRKLQELAERRRDERRVTVVGSTASRNR